MLRRTLLSALLTASLLAADVALLVLYLNPSLQLGEEALSLGAVVFLPCLLAASLAFGLLSLIGRLLRGRPRQFRPPLEALPWFTSFALLAVSSGAALFWMNLFTYRYSIPVEFVRGLAGASVALSGAALVLAAVGADALLFPLRGRGLSAPLVVLACAAAVVLPLALRPRRAPAPRPVPLATETVHPARRVILVGIDGVGPRQVAQGVLPFITRLITLKKGAYGALATFRPTEGAPVWTTICTGRLPRDHGVKSLVTYRLIASESVYELLPRGVFVGLLERAGLVSRVPVLSTARRCKALWTTLNAFGIATGVVRIWGTQPPERVQGFMLSQYYDYYLQRHDPRVTGTVHPPDLLPQIAARAVAPADVDQALLSQFIDLSAEIPGDAREWRRDLVDQALAPDMTYERAGQVLRAAYDPPFFATYFYGMDAASHAFMRFAEPDRFGDVRPEEVRRYGRVIQRYGTYLSQSLERIAQGPRQGEILLVVSAYGMDAVPFWRRVLSGWGIGPAVSGTHSAAPDGFIAAVGDGVRAGGVIRGASVLDVAPTVLYLMGLPVARDMEGRVLTEIVDEEFERAHPLTYIPSYESLAVTPVRGPADIDVPPLPEEGP
jgi:predicted AlkP superfamily phosphohydrolase/phosphomutase